MNELQQVLLIFAIIVIVGLYFLQKIKARNSDKSVPGEKETQENSPRQDAYNALNQLGDAHIPISNRTQNRLQIEEEEEQVPESQLGLSFGQEFDVEAPKASEPEQKVEEMADEDQRKPKHVVLEVEDMQPLGSEEDPVSASDYEPSFGIPDEGIQKPNEEAEVEQREPQLFAIIVMGTDDFLWPKVNQTLQGVGLVPSETGIFVKNDSMGNEIIRVANLMEPGTFPLDQPTNSELKTVGVVLILELPTTVKAPAVMHDMIMMSRKISQRLNGRLYDANRHLLKESDLQAMRDAAVAYESSAI
ncbi:cell division protein ZipA C-terminal FtsZ-binding domain-containing protein [Hydrogenovibrio sp. 3SP14C1]|uniref:cell division protein ZipA C-terminal FtsZ-binding domain-containing protein n=1 Tax=Hydrogenovibrio sp. 3SP14C1 TaxID=3038774 RepID=UPI002416D957|nr:cell division protein ZipA C-terminal FtsZ-binding domain-containing protein [Hydrogenovibrio sp. 3SP14C1]MDG4812801.1 cell division protein ZipA C-terminal FtsZ-binding domain-containing protein [Hydrogenovibrio sp. 3SP14C1]